MFSKKLKKYFKKKGFVDENCIENKYYKESYNELMEELNNTKTQWKAAKNLFDNSTDPCQVDYSIYLMEVYEKKIKLLYKKLRDLNPEE